MHQFTYSTGPGELSGKYTDNSRLTTVGLCRCWTTTEKNFRQSTCTFTNFSVIYRTPYLLQYQYEKSVWMEALQYYIDVSTSLIKIILIKCLTLIIINSEKTDVTFEIVTSMVSPLKKIS